MLFLYFEAFVEFRSFINLEKKKGYSYKKDRHTPPVIKSMKENIQEASKQPRSLTPREVSREMKGNLEWHGLVG